jgi:hypothetical protein
MLNRKSFMVCLLLGTAVVFVASGALAGQASMNIAGRLQLFVDRHLIDKLEGAAGLRLQRPTMREVVIVHDKPWEGNTCSYHTAFKDDKIYRMYYRGSHHEGEKKTHPEYTCYAESRDGIRWSKPELGLVEFEGSKKNNIIWTGEGAHNFTPFKDANPDCAEGAKYKAFGGKGKPGLYAFQSSDGIHWKRIGDEPVIAKGRFDSQNLAFWDAVRSEYRAYFRDSRDGVRDIKTATSKDFLHWSEPQWLEFPGAPREHLYTNQIRPYYRAPRLFIGFPSRYIPDRGSLVEGLFMTGRDGRTFQRWEEAIIPPGTNKDRWQNRGNYIWWGLVETDSDLPGAGKELSLYTSERDDDGSGAKTRRYTYRIDGFVSLRAPFSGGTALTKPFTFSGARLLLNVSTSAAGSVRVEARDADGKPIEGFRASDCPEIYGDEIERVVSWNSGEDVSRLQGRPIRLLFFLKDADVYAFRFADGAQQGAPADAEKPRLGVFMHERNDQALMADTPAVGRPERCRAVVGMGNAKTDMRKDANRRGHLQAPRLDRPVSQFDPGGALLLACGQPHGRLGSLDRLP